ncbi:glutamate receptor ionotropic, NMDA 2A-like isoform X2 [Ptychodera flava]|uniref:glutamate receptor ionotropic, NMDA 2A-like isoform X2 n=1 Tax=Ptychodera flava TaxID=63121 RepID=UPI00396A3522
MICCGVMRLRKGLPLTLFVALVLHGLTISTARETVKIGLIHSHSTLKPHQHLGLYSETDGVSISVQPLQLPSTNPYDSVTYLQQSICDDGLAGVIYASDGDALEQIPEASFVAWTAEDLKIPTISVSSPVTFQDLNWIGDVVHLQALLEDTCKVMLTFLENFGWKHAVLVTGNDPISLEFEIAMEYISQSEFNSMTVTAHNIDFNTDINDDVLSLYNSQCSIFMVYANFENAKKLFEVAKKREMLKEGFVWITAGTVMDNIDALREHFPSGFIGIKLRNPDHNMSRTIKDAIKLYEAAILDYANKGKDVSKLQAPGCEKNDAFANDSSLTLMPFLSRQVVNKRRLFFEAKYVIVNIDENFHIKQIGTWQTNEIQLDRVTWLGKSQPENYASSPELFGQRIQIVTVEETPFISSLDFDEHAYRSCTNGILCTKVRESDGEATEKCCGGYAVDLLRELSRTVEGGFEYDLYVKESYGRYIMESRQWNGVVGDLVYGRADMVVGGLKLSSERQKVLDFSVPFMASGVSVIVEQSRGKTPPRAVWDPFNFLVWIMALLVFLWVTSIIVFFFEWFSPTGYARRYTEPRGSNFTFEDSIWMTWALVFNNSLPHRVPKSVSGKFMTTVWAFYSLVFIALYTANLTAHMIKVETKLPIRGFMDPKMQNPYSANTKIKFATVQNTNTESLIASFNYRMHGYMKEYLVESAEQGIQLLDEGKLDVFIYDAMVAEYLASRDRQCDLITVDSAFAMAGYAVAFTRGSPWREKFDEALLKFIDNGFLNSLRAKWFKLDSCLKRESQNENTDHLGPDNVSGAFFFLGGGIAASVIVILGEYVFYKYVRSWFVLIFKEKASISLVSETLGKFFYPSQSVETSTFCCEACYREMLEKRARLDETNARIKELEALLGLSDAQDSGESSRPVTIWHANNTTNRDDAASECEDLINQSNKEILSMETTL